MTPTYEQLDSCRFLHFCQPGDHRGRGADCARLFESSGIAMLRVGFVVELCPVVPAGHFFCAPCYNPRWPQRALAGRCDWPRPVDHTWGVGCYRAGERHAHLSRANAVHCHRDVRCHSGQGDLVGARGGLVGGSPAILWQHHDCDADRSSNHEAASNQITACSWLVCNSHNQRGRCDRYPRAD